MAQSYANSEAPCIGRCRAGRRPASRGARPADRPAVRRRPAGGGHRGDAGATGAGDDVLGGGVESMSNMVYFHRHPVGQVRAGSVALYDRLDRGRVRSPVSALLSYPVRQAGR